MAAPVPSPDVIAATATALGAADAAKGITRGTADIVLTIADRLGHSRKSRHTATWGYCPLIDPHYDMMLATYAAARGAA